MINDSCCDLSETAIENFDIKSKIIEQYYAHLIKNNYDECSIYKLMHNFCYFKNEINDYIFVDNIDRKNSDRAFNFVEDVLKLKSCKKFPGCSKCYDTVQFIVEENFTMSDNFICDNLVRLFAITKKYGLVNQFKNIYLRIKTLIDSDNLEIWTNTLLMSISLSVDEENYYRIAIFLIDRGANPYVVVDGNSFFGYVHLKLIKAKIQGKNKKVKILDNLKEHMIFGSVKHSKVEALQNYLLKVHKKICKYNSFDEVDLDLLFYIGSIEVTDSFLKKIMDCFVPTSNAFYSQITELDKKLFEKKLKNPTMSEYFDYRCYLAKIEVKFIDNTSDAKILKEWVTK